MLLRTRRVTLPRLPVSRMNLAPVSSVTVGGGRLLNTCRARALHWAPAASPRPHFGCICSHGTKSMKKCEL